MEYINCILSKETTIAFLKHVNSIELKNGELNDFFERAKVFDDVSLIICLKYFFHIVDKIKKGKNIELTCEDLINTAKNIEDENIGHLTNLIYNDEEFILSLLQFDYLAIKNGETMNLDQVLASVLQIKYKGQII